MTVEKRGRTGQAGGRAGGRGWGAAGERRIERKGKRERGREREKRRERKGKREKIASGGGRSGAECGSSASVAGGGKIADDEEDFGWEVLCEVMCMIIWYTINVSTVRLNLNGLKKDSTGRGSLPQTHP
ncbi:hypothetical protein TIFTF001_030087 [Ficus carica]|uniref:Uncharacterized protein n=1 Tax=Ficus carica TaxID=3494 RepID=A0AA88J3N7_FICCA|nr:hypothetical protein TIFTF001_030087 [Ficus carica]